MQRETTNENWIRLVLWLAAFFNLVAALLFLFPDSLPGRLAGVPTPVPSIYSGLTAWLILIFGGAYAWMARGPLVRPLLVLATIGKTGAFVVALAVALRGDIPPRLAALISGDLFLACGFAVWLRRSSAE